MARKKREEKVEELENELPDTEASEAEMEEAMEAEEIEAAEAALEEEVEEDEAPKKRAPRARKSTPRKRKEPSGPVAQLFEAASKVEDVVMEAPSAPIEAENAPAAPAPVAVEEAAVVAAAPAPSPAAKRTAVPADAKAWATVDNISASISTNLEHVSKMLKEIPEQYSGALNDLLKSPAPRPTILQKAAVGMSALAILLSIVSIALSNSVRAKVYSQELAKIEAPAKPVAVNRPARAEARQSALKQLTLKPIQVARKAGKK